MAALLIAEEKAQKRLIESLFLTTYGLTAQPIPEQQTKTPDWKVFAEDDFAFFCELKSLDDPWLDELLDNAPPGQIVGGGRNDPIYNRIGSAIERAVKQFDTVNPDRAFPNILVLLNIDSASSVPDLFAILTGNFYAEDGSTSPIYKQFSEGRIKSKKEKIDLFIWVQKIDNQQKTQFCFNTDSPFLEKVCGYFKVASTDINLL